MRPPIASAVQQRAQAAYNVNNQGAKKEEQKSPSTPVAQKDAYGRIVQAVKGQGQYKPSVPLQIIPEKQAKPAEPSAP